VSRDKSHALRETADTDTLSDRRLTSSFTTGYMVLTYYTNGGCQGANSQYGQQLGKCITDSSEGDSHYYECSTIDNDPESLSRIMYYFNSSDCTGVPRVYATTMESVCDSATGDDDSWFENLMCTRNMKPWKKLPRSVVFEYYDDLSECEDKTPSGAYKYVALGTGNCFESSTDSFKAEKIKKCNDRGFGVLYYNFSSECLLDAEHVKHSIQPVCEVAGEGVSAGGEEDDDEFIAGQRVSCWVGQGPSDDRGPYCYNSYTSGNLVGSMFIIFVIGTVLTVLTFAFFPIVAQIRPMMYIYLIRLSGRSCNLPVDLFDKYKFTFVQEQFYGKSYRLGRYHAPLPLMNYRAIDHQMGDLIADNVGMDNVGEYVIGGVYCYTLGALIMQKKYIRGSLNDRDRFNDQNEGQTVTIHMFWDNDKGMFIGSFTFNFFFWGPCVAYPSDLKPEPDPKKKVVVAYTKVRPPQPFVCTEKFPVAGEWFGDIEVNDSWVKYIAKEFQARFCDGPCRDFFKLKRQLVRLTWLNLFLLWFLPVIAVVMWAEANSFYTESGKVNVYFDNAGEAAKHWPAGFQLEATYAVFTILWAISNIFTLITGRRSFDYIWYIVSLAVGCALLALLFSTSEFAEVYSDKEVIDYSTNTTDRCVRQAASLADNSHVLCAYHRLWPNFCEGANDYDKKHTCLSYYVEGNQHGHGGCDDVVPLYDVYMNNAGWGLTFLLMFYYANGLLLYFPHVFRRSDTAKGRALPRPLSKRIYCAPPEENEYIAAEENEIEEFEHVESTIQKSSVVNMQ